MSAPRTFFATTAANSVKSPAEMVKEFNQKRKICLAKAVNIGDDLRKKKREIEIMESNIKDLRVSQKNLEDQRTQESKVSCPELIPLLASKLKSVCSDIEVVDATFDSLHQYMSVKLKSEKHYELRSLLSINNTFDEKLISYTVGTGFGNKACTYDLTIRSTTWENENGYEFLLADLLGVTPDDLIPKQEVAPKL